MDENYIIVIPYAGFDLRNGYIAIFRFEDFDILNPSTTEEYIREYMQPTLATDPDANGMLVFGIKFKKASYLSDAAKALGIGTEQPLDVCVNLGMFNQIQMINKTSQFKYKTMIEWWGEIPEHYHDAYSKTGEYWQRVAQSLASKNAPRSAPAPAKQMAPPPKQQMVPPRNTAPMIVRQQQPVRQVVQQSTQAQQRRRF